MGEDKRGALWQAQARRRSGRSTPRGCSLFSTAAALASDSSVGTGHSARHAGSVQRRRTASMSLCKELSEGAGPTRGSWRRAAHARKGRARKLREPLTTCTELGCPKFDDLQGRSDASHLSVCRGSEGDHARRRDLRNSRCSPPSSCRPPPPPLCHPPACLLDRRTTVFVLS